MWPFIGLSTRWFSVGIGLICCFIKITESVYTQEYIDTCFRLFSTRVLHHSQAKRTNTYTHIDVVWPDLFDLCL
ncbi:hypothetical protein Hanom_Chr11g00980941 [Helianthus anomalus]